MSSPAPSEARSDEAGAGEGTRRLRGGDAGGAAADPPLPPLARLQQALDRLLVLDVFLVIGAALWFGVAVVLHARGLEAPLRLFQQLWEPLFTPAIGLLMGAALLSGALGWWRRRGQR